MGLRLWNQHQPRRGGENGAGSLERRVLLLDHRAPLGLDGERDLLLLVGRLRICVRGSQGERYEAGGVGERRGRVRAAGSDSGPGRPSHRRLRQGHHPHAPMDGRHGPLRIGYLVDRRRCDRRGILRRLSRRAVVERGQPVRLSYTVRLLRGPDQGAGPRAELGHLRGGCHESHHDRIGGGRARKLPRDPVGVRGHTRVQLREGVVRGGGRGGGGHERERHRELLQESDRQRG
mmetsp:Transcript_63228/g.186939  ORF Transcript_63228/g.186939 Transcript_63228/m.186939 type:complete len:233 (+) Transcript_63228:419-1117(+)